SVRSGLHRPGATELGRARLEGDQLVAPRHQTRELEAPVRGADRFARGVATAELGVDRPRGRLVARLEADLGVLEPLFVTEGRSVSVGDDDTAEPVSGSVDHSTTDLQRCRA